MTVLAATPPVSRRPGAPPTAARRDACIGAGRARRATAASSSDSAPKRLVAVFGADGPARRRRRSRAVRAARELGLPAGIATGEVGRGGRSSSFTAGRRARPRGSGDAGSTSARAHSSARSAVSTRRSSAASEELRPSARGASTPLAEEGRCRVVTVVGEPGIGKTRLGPRAGAASRKRATTVLVARCIAHGQGVTFMPLLEALRRAELSAGAGGRVGRRTGARPASPRSPKELSSAPLGESYWAVRRLLEALARTRPVLLLLDDVHWAEPALARPGRLPRRPAPTRPSARPVPRAARAGPTAR